MPDRLLQPNKPITSNPNSSAISNNSNVIIIATIISNPSNITIINIYSINPINSTNSTNNTIYPTINGYTIDNNINPINIIINGSIIINIINYVNPKTIINSNDSYITNINITNCNIIITNGITINYTINSVTISKNTNIHTNTSETSFTSIPTTATQW